MNRDEKATEIIHSSEMRIEVYYPAGIPQIAFERLKREQEHLEKTDEATLDQLLSFREDSKTAYDAGKLLWTTGAAANTIFTFLLGCQQPNPLPAHEYCEACGFFELGETALGMDLPERKCPCCGVALRKDGFSLPEDFAWGKRNELHYEYRASDMIRQPLDDNSLVRPETYTIEKALRDPALGIPNAELTVALWHEGDLTYQCLANYLLSAYASLSDENGEDLSLSACYTTLHQFGVFCREDVFDLMLRLGAERKDALSVAERIRKGRYHSGYGERGTTDDLPECLKELASSVRYLPSRGQAAAIQNRIC